MDIIFLLVFYEWLDGRMRWLLLMMDLLLEVNEMKMYKRSKERSFVDEVILYVCFVGFLVLIVGMV